jgi:glycosyltransferase involved in cell wall biosynthesis
MIKILGVFNEITNTTIPIENFHRLSNSDFEKHAYSFYSRPAEAMSVVESLGKEKMAMVKVVGNLNWVIRIIELARLILRGGYDIIHIHHTLTSVLVVLILKVFRNEAKLVFTVHNDYKYYTIYQKLIFNFVLNNVDKVICNSNNTFSSISHLSINSNYEIIYNGVNDDKILTSSERYPGRLRILFAARLVPQKNILFLLRAINRLNISGHEFEIDIVGSGSQEKLARNFVLQNNLTEKVSFLGRLERSEVYRLMSKADIFVVPSLFEGFCNAMVEAMLSRCIIVASRVDPLPEVTGGDANAVFYNLQDLDGLYGALKEIVSEIDSYYDMAEKSMQYAHSNYTLEICALNHSKSYKAMLLC